MSRPLTEVWADLLAAGVQWREGMLVDLHGTGKGWHLARIDEVYPDRPWIWISDHLAYAPASGCGNDWDYPQAVLMLEDPATQGCLLAEVRRLAPDGRSVSVDYEDGIGRWCVTWEGQDDWQQASGTTEGEALIAALCSLTGVSR